VRKKQKIHFPSQITVFDSVFQKIAANDIKLYCLQFYVEVAVLNLVQKLNAKRM
jgi:hypothetical protein